MPAKRQPQKPTATGRESSLKNRPLHVPLTLEQLAKGLLNAPPKPKQPTEADVKTPKAKPTGGAKKPARKKP